MNAAAATPDDLLVLLEPPVQQIDLGGEAVALGVSIEVGEVRVVLDGLVVHREVEVLAEGASEGRLARTNHAGDADEQIV